MSAESLKTTIDDLQRRAISVAEIREHRAILLTPGCLTSISNLTRLRGSLSAAAHAVCAQQRPPWAVIIHEGWMLREDAPEWVRQSVVGPGGRGVGGVLIADLDPVYRTEVLTLYGEDDEGNWHSRTFEIRARAPGGLTLIDDVSGDANDGREQGGMRGFVPRKQEV